MSESFVGPADLALLFISHHHGPDFAPILEDIAERIAPGHLLGCTGESIVGEAQEVEDAPALSLWLARLPDVTLEPMRLEFERPRGGNVRRLARRPARAVAPGGAVVLGEPFSFPADYLLERLNEERPGAPVIGGMASGAQAPGGNRLFLDGQVFDPAPWPCWSMARCGFARSSRKAAGRSAGRWSSPRPTASDPGTGRQTAVGPIARVVQ